MNGIRVIVSSLAGAAAIGALIFTTCLQAQTIGMVADNETKSVVVFNADTDTVIGSVALPSGVAPIVGDCSITSDGSLGFVTNFYNQVYVIDLSAAPPALAAGVNPIGISNWGEDTSLTADGRCLVVCDGEDTVPVSAIDVATRTEVSTVALAGGKCNSVDVCADGTVLATSPDGVLHRLAIDSACHLTSPNATVPIGSDLPRPNNVACAPDSNSAVVTNLTINNWGSPGDVRSFTVSPLAPVSTQILTGSWAGVSAVFDPSGNALYARSDYSGHIDAFSYDSAGGVIGGPLEPFPQPVDDSYALYGNDSVAVHPNGGKLYVSQYGRVDVYDLETGAHTSMTDAAIVEPTGICLSPPRPESPAAGYVTVGDCMSGRIQKNCSGLKGRARAQCNQEQQASCFDSFE